MRVVVSWRSWRGLLVANDGFAVMCCRAGVLGIMRLRERSRGTQHVVAHGTGGRSAGEDEMHHQQ